MKIAFVLILFPALSFAAYYDPNASTGTQNDQKTQYPTENNPTPTQTQVDQSYKDPNKFYHNQPATQSYFDDPDWPHIKNKR